MASQRWQRVFCALVLIASPAAGYACLAGTASARGWSFGLASAPQSVLLQYDCGLQEDGLDYVTRASLYRVSPIQTPEACQMLCQDDSRCGSWSWGKAESESVSAVCYLKALGKTEQPEKRYSSDTITGIACRGVHVGAVSANRTLHAEVRNRTRLDASHRTAERPLLQGGGACGQIEDGVDYWTNTLLYQFTPVMSAERCKAKCKAEPLCAVWTWGKPGGSNSLANAVCSLMGRGGHPVSFQNEDVVSGRACPDDVADSAETQRKHLVVELDGVALWRKRPTSLCDLVESGAEYGRNSTRATTLRNVDSASACRRFCKGNFRCGAWSWRPGSGQDIARGLGKRGLCRLLADVAPSRVRHAGHVSGIVCHLGGSDDDGHVRHVETIDELDDDSRSWIARKMGPADAAQKEEEPHGFSLADLSGVFGVGGGGGGRDGDERVQVCPLPERDVDFATEADLEQREKVDSASVCQRLCTEDAGCGAWSWGEGSVVRIVGSENFCWLKVLHEPTQPTRSFKAGIVSGFPCTNQTRSKVDATEEKAVIVGEGNWREQLDGRDQKAEAFPPGSLYCYALMQPEGYEKGLIQMQYRMRVSIFSCDEPAVYSNQVIDIVPGYQTHVVDSDLKCGYGGEFMTALNTPIFIAVWKKVVEVGRFRLHDWTVKVDPDCVFVPDRLRARLEYHKPDFPGQAVYLNNCQMGLHGPFEVLSREAVQVWMDNKGECAKQFEQLCAGDCLWGEDMYLDQCFIRVLHDQVRRDDDFDLLVEDHCAPPPGWDSCQDTSKAAFHPFKTEEGYRSCLVGTGLLQELSF